MKRRFHLFILLMVMMVFSSCFDILEEITLHDDGSGKIEVTLNLSKSKTKIKSIMLMDSINSYKVPSEDDIKTNISKITSELNKINGVKNIHKSIDFEEFVFSIRCEFDEVTTLNKVIKHFNSISEFGTIDQTDQFAYDHRSKTFKRSHNVNLANEVKKIPNKDREVLEGAGVTTIYRFDSQIGSYSNKNAKLSPSKKAIMLKVDAQELIQNKKDIQNTITLK